MNNISKEDIREKELCPNCGSLTNPNSIICQVCNGIISNTSTIDPPQTIQDEGRLYRNLVVDKPKPVVLIGTWVMLFPCFIIGTGFSIYILFTGIGGGLVNFVGFWIMAILAYISFMFLFRVTRNYFALAPREADKWD